jgi:hypothetical protein
MRFDSRPSRLLSGRPQPPGKSSFIYALLSDGRTSLRRASPSDDRILGTMRAGMRLDLNLAVCGDREPVDRTKTYW